MEALKKSRSRLLQPQPYYTTHHHTHSFFLSSPLLFSVSFSIQFGRSLCRLSSVRARAERTDSKTSNGRTGYAAKTAAAARKRERHKWKRKPIKVVQGEEEADIWLLLPSKLHN